MNEEFLRIYNLYKDDVLRLAFSYTKKLTDAEDVTQNVFIKLYNNINSLKNEEHIKKWCMTVTVNECKNFYRSFWKRKILSIEENDNNKYIIDYDDNHIKDALFKLKPRLRIIIYLYYYEGYKVKEIADILKLNPNTVQTNLTRAREKLKISLKGEIEK